MSHSTTTTATYVLVKYSRSYPQGVQETNSEWQHYTKPTLKLILDVKKSLSTGELESVFLRIIWSMENSYAQDQSELTFENIDLLSFSSFPAGQTDRAQGGLPLKAVYRDSVVGIRYINASSGTFRRFQVTFSSPNDASQFIDSISSVCPCKPNSTTGAPPAALPRMMPAPSMVPSTLHHPIAKPSMNTSAHIRLPPGQNDVFSPVTSSTRLPNYPTMHFHQHSNSPYASASGMPMPSSQMIVDFRNQLPSSSPPLLPNSTQQAFEFNPSQAHSPSNSAQPAFQFNPTQAHSPSISAQPAFQFNPSQAHPPSTPYTPTPTQSEHPFYSQASSANTHTALVQITSNQLPEPAVSRLKVESSEKGVQTTDQFVIALQEATSLYDMPHHALEKLVGDVVREDGFVSLMESLSSMWKIRGYVHD
ncbi:hypothetical protein EV361DRAFT_528064 [Lentinula raphanica]|uniref:Proteophosphoglycan 5 n=1 Tax=Lentinula raphanica TaxID=153919 RepID=A0AA38P1L9_9AGAR|nr:hypothetical protein F5878DRAFT_349263 [Lentinula raphanica]KAJ3966952.1 hypothetical protein EV361DRAFT_528064 [Lentinula raphanica]